MLFYIGGVLLPSLIIGATFMIVPKINREEEIVQEEELDEEEEEVVSVGQVLIGNAPLYSDMSGTRILVSMEKGALADIVAKCDERWLVKYGEIRGYIDSDYIVQVNEFDQKLYEQPVIVLNEGVYQEEGQELQDLDSNESEDTDDAGNRESDAEIETLSSKVICVLKDELERRGYIVIQIPEREDEGLSDRECCEMANEIRADAYLTISEDDEVNGIQVICPVKDNPYGTVRLYKQSHQLSEYIMDACTAEIGGEKGDPEERDDLAEIKWSRVPITILKVGSLKNEVEEIQDENCQIKIALGIANGVDYYFGKRSVFVPKDIANEKVMEGREEDPSGQKADQGENGTVSANEIQ